MKIVNLALILFLFVIGCSKKEAATDSAQFALTRSDVAMPIEVSTNKDGPNTIYSVHIQLSSSAEAEICKFSRQHQNQLIGIMVGTNVIMKVQVPSGGLKPPVDWRISSDAFDDVKPISDRLNELGK